jgi:hypothetical protein
MPEQLLQAAGRLLSPPKPIECRVHDRHACEVPVACQPAAAWGRKDAQWPAVISDLSQGGALLIVGRRFELGVGLGIELPGGDGEDPYTVLAKVVNVRATPDGSWALGCKFVSELGEDELQRLLGPRPPAAAEPEAVVPSKVASPPPPRANGSGKRSIPNVLLQLEIRPGKVIHCRIRNLTAPAGWSPVAGKPMTLRLEAPPQPLIRLEVLHCLPQGQRLVIRCRLLSPTWEGLLRALRCSV